MSHVKKHAWGQSTKLTPNMCPIEVHTGVFTHPFVYSSVHYHELKSNRIICNYGKIQVDIFTWDLSVIDLQNNTVQYSDYETIILLPGEDIVIEADYSHRICGLEDMSLMTEIYQSEYPECIPDSEDIVRLISSGQKMNMNT